MSDVSTLEAQLRASPDDWGCWLVYADYLQEQGDVRGTLIALEHQLATAELSAASRRFVKRRVDTLVDVHRARWLHGWRRPENTELVWRHGFVCGMSFQGISNQTVDTRICEPLESLAASSTGRLLRDVGVHRLRGPEDLASLLQCEVVHRLCALHLGSCSLGDEGVEELVRAAPQLPALTSLSLPYNHIGDEGALALARCEALRGLTWLDLTGNALGPPSARALKTALPGCTLRL